MSSPPRNEVRKNAFALLMTSATKKSPSRKHKGESNFVLCENCNKSFAFTTIIAHREQCIMTDASGGGGHSKGRGDIVEKTSSETNDFGESHLHGAQVSEKEASSRKRQRNPLPDLNAAVNAEANETMGSQNDVNTLPPKRNAFNHMLKNSKKAFAETKTQTQTFHLLEVDGKLDLQFFCDDNEGVPSNIAWTGKLMIRASKEASDNEQPVELNITSSIRSEAEFATVHYVKQHSKFSVPVLKSILQKSIRRRRPKPSVRLAMELADKSFGELIRRLPIICLEDSFLHHEFPFLVWLMIACSKDYVPPKRLVDKVMQIVFEIASCPWQDECNHIPHNDRTPPSFSLSGLAQNDSIHINDSEQCHLILRSMVLRKKYGGLKCDMHMIDQYMNSWNHRYHNRQVEKSVVTNLLRRFPQLNHDVHWKDVPALIHSLTSAADLDPILKTGFLKLELNDISTSGIDFHCSNIISILLDHTSVFYNNLIALIGCKSDTDVEAIIKKIMWDYSSGKNNRRQILEQGSNATRRTEGEEKLKILWDRDASPLVKKFTDAYVATRLR